MVDPQRKGPQIVEFARARPAAAAGGYRIPMTAACHWSLIRSSGNISVLNFLCAVGKSKGPRGLSVALVLVSRACELCDGVALSRGVARSPRGER